MILQFIDELVYSSSYSVLLVNTRAGNSILLSVFTNVGYDASAFRGLSTPISL